MKMSCVEIITGKPCVFYEYTKDLKHAASSCKYCTAKAYCISEEAADLFGDQFDKDGKYIGESQWI